jgi:predicted GH43/DUF377 family glycosyl hydrolase
LDIGELGAFDDCGVMPHSILKIRHQYVMYYTGWSKSVTVAFSFHIGIAVSDTLNGPFVRYSRAPVIGRNHYDPFIVGAPYVLNNGSHFTMLYVSCIKWESNPNQSTQHFYTIKTAHSHDGFHWEPEPDVTIKLATNEHSIARPVVYKNKEEFELWFSFRGGEKPYSLGFATSNDLKSWQRNPQVFEPTKNAAWDGDMLCYGYPFDYLNKKHLLYNGNSYGKAGCGLAIL